MALTDRETVITHYCSACGALTEGRFCSSCGHENTLADIPTTKETGRRFEPSAGRPPKPVAEPAGRGGDKRSRVVALCVAAVIGVAAAAVAAVILLGGGSSSASPYKRQLTEALAPVVSTNQMLSRSLQSLDGSKSSVRAATRAAAQSQSALTGARGAVAVLSVPASDRGLSQQVSQALTDENGYLQAVASTLATPTGSSAGQLQTLATGAQSALVAISTVAVGAGASLNGADNLQSWAHGAQAAQAAAQRKAQHKAAQPASAQAATTVTVPSSSSATPSSGGASAVGSLDCGGGLTAGAHTSCAFAANVQQAWQNAPGVSNTITAYSPVTGQSYTESCGPQASGGILCTGVGADNSVWWQ